MTHVLVNAVEHASELVRMAAKHRLGQSSRTSGCGKNKQQQQQ
jgi:hypothetical protein